ncbi:MAG: TonB-dependent receptor [Mesorhizobium sp.]|uniref:OmpP1/FadL family transporter n=1 Tax=Mesorhizobium sp. TaxID=1871066 RepID=UPI000FEA7FE7|nr:outer membrane protein transport protein [Mesorhizobium sp.]RWH82081.1 MAG: TonB-dependent receptor [Mesorhizobium sp.]RWH85080.1 MAG: TonB-dependent receptor [Mesorhizobium sp.]RWH89836.1 MAG: TonB-dependent receptor [Mesorhizobium sp.]RWH98415.1 MAG: TonB-dependent receptor [Mesorhizobium sp.]RWI04577.1 MAG: TonB-dependent receptor [Mesorhizobium sp.]
MDNLRLKALLGAGCFSLLISGVANAGGFDRGGVNIDQLFDAAPYSFDAGVTYVSPQRTLKNVQRLDGSGMSSSSVDVGGDYAVPRIGIKANIFEPVDCLASYTEPYGAEADFGMNNAYSPTAVEYYVKTNDFGLTCSYKINVGKGSLRFIGGVSYQEVDAFLSRQTLLAFGNTGLGKFKLSDEAWGWRVGAAYEIPEIALRASLMYSSSYKYDGLSGTVDTTGFAGGPLGNVTGVFPVSASAEIPQAVEFKLQSGIAPGWLAFGSVRWQEWSKLGIIPINGVINPVFGTPSPVSFDLLYRDGWTVSGGIAHKFTDQLSGAVSLTWDRGTSTTSGYQSDTWSVASGISYSPNDKIEVRLGGSIGVLTSGSSTFTGVGDTANAITYTYDDDLLLAGSASVKVKF